MADVAIQPFAPDYAVAPGETLRESLEVLGMTQTELAERTGLARKTINGIVNAKEPITWDSAIQFEKVLRVPAHFWVNLQVNHDAARARIQDSRRLAAYGTWIKEFGIPLKELTERGAIPPARQAPDAIRAVCDFFGVASPEEFDIVWRQTADTYTYRKSAKHPAKLGAVAAWLRLGELESMRVKCAPFDRHRFEETIVTVRDRANEPVPKLFEELISMLASCGVALVIVPAIQGAPIYGATRWMTPSKVLIQLSLRGRDDGHFWFTLLHEFAHVLLHGKKELFLELDNGKVTAQETEADNWACAQLIPQAEYLAFLAAHGGGAKPRPLRISKSAIIAFAERVRVSPGVVVGRMQHDGWVPYTHCNDLKVRLPLS